MEQVSCSCCQAEVGTYSSHFDRYFKSEQAVLKCVTYAELSEAEISAHTLGFIGKACGRRRIIAFFCQRVASEIFVPAASVLAAHGGAKFKRLDVHIWLFIDSTNRSKHNGDLIASLFLSVSISPVDRSQIMYFGGAVHSLSKG